MRLEELVEECKLQPDCNECKYDGECRTFLKKFSVRPESVLDIEIESEVIRSE